MSAELITRFKSVSEGAIIQMTIWQVPAPVPPSTHSYKYSLAYVVAGKRVIGYDNERGKGDHRHLGDEEFPYEFVGIDQLIEDFIAEVAKWRN